MEKDIQRIFEYFPDLEIGIVGSMTWKPKIAQDIDVLVLPTVDWKALMASLNAKYNGWDVSLGHLRRANIHVPGLNRKVQLLCNSNVKMFKDWPHCVILRDGTRLHDGIYFCKQDFDGESNCTDCGVRICAFCQGQDSTCEFSHKIDCSRWIER